jgi:predicted DNA-binding transcriptional regulator AlpA
MSTKDKPEIKGPYFMGREELFAKLAISQSTFDALTNPKSQHYDPDFPKPCRLFTGQKLRYSSVDVDAYILSLSHNSAA